MKFEGSFNTASWKKVWGLLALDARWQAEFIDLQLRFEDGCLKVAEHHRTDSKLPDRIIGCFLYIFDFRSWSDTRWAAVGKVCRRLCTSLLCGLKDLIQYLHKLPGESTYYIDGFQHLAQELEQSQRIF